MHVQQWALQLFARLLPVWAVERAGRRIHPEAACQAAFQRGRSTCGRRNSPRAHPRPAGIGTGWLCPKRASVRAGCVQTEAGCKGWSCPKRASLRAGCVQTVYHVHVIRKLRLSFFCLPVFRRHLFASSRESVSLFLCDFFGIFYVFLSWKDIQFSGVIFLQKKSRFRRLKNSAY